MKQQLFRRLRACLIVAISSVAIGSAVSCGSGEHAQLVSGPGGCIDKDGDGCGVGCWAGPDCNDNDPKVVCNGQAPCDANPSAPGCPCTAEGTTQACGTVHEQSAS